MNIRTIIFPGSKNKKTNIRNFVSIFYIFSNILMFLNTHVFLYSIIAVQITYKLLKKVVRVLICS